MYTLQYTQTYKLSYRCSDWHSLKNKHVRKRVRLWWK